MLVRGTSKTIAIMMTITARRRRRRRGHSVQCPQIKGQCHGHAVGRHQPPGRGGGTAARLFPVIADLWPSSSSWRGRLLSTESPASSSNHPCRCTYCTSTEQSFAVLSWWHGVGVILYVVGCLMTPSMSFWKRFAKIVLTLLCAQRNTGVKLVARNRNPTNGFTVNKKVLSFLFTCTPTSSFFTSNMKLKIL